MATDLEEIDQESPSEHAVSKAAAVLRSGGVVVIPSDALYTIVADPLNLHAVGRVFAAKGRETQRSLPMLVSDLMMAEELTKDVSSRFHILARRFWPGPLTLIVPASARVPLKVTGNTGRLAVRMPKAKIAQALIEKMGHPLVGTSANVSGTPTAKAGIEVFGLMDGLVDLVLDGGLCAGDGSTTVDITEPYWRLIKEGAIPEKEIAECLSDT